MNTSTGRIYIKIAISKWKQVPCELFGKKPRNIPTCEQCGIFTQTWATLICDHKLCEECFNQSMEYICPKDHYRTTKDQAKGGNCTHELKYAVICCPGCDVPKLFKDLTPHISALHPELLTNVDEASRHLEPKTARCDARSKRANQDHIKSYGKEHEKRCPDHGLDCTWCKEQVDVTTPCPARERKETVETLRTSRASNHCDANNKRTELIGDVQEMKERIKELEDTMNRIEKPLQKIIQRLSREQ